MSSSTPCGDSELLPQLPAPPWKSQPPVGSGPTGTGKDPHAHAPGSCAEAHAWARYAGVRAQGQQAGARGRKTRCASALLCRLTAVRPPDPNSPQVYSICPCRVPRMGAWPLPRRTPHTLTPSLPGSSHRTQTLDTRTLCPCVRQAAHTPKRAPKIHRSPHGYTIHPKPYLRALVRDLISAQIRYTVGGGALSPPDSPALQGQLLLA